jgi:hypothetical protein
LLSGKTKFKTLIGYMSRVINYGEPVSQCVTVSEEGLIQIDPTRGDLIVRGEMACWADPVKGEGKETSLDDANHWKMTRLSIQCAARGGWTAERIIASLAQRVEQDLPPLLIVAIRSWVAGIRASHTPSPVAIARDVVLQVTDNDVAEAIAASAMLQPYLRSRLGLNTFLVRGEEVKTLRKQLAAFGLQVGNDLTFDPGNLTDPSDPTDSKKARS